MLLNKSQDWELDPNGNWSSTTIERPGGTVAEVRQVNAVNEYTKIGYVPTNHDANGNMLFDGQRAYTYDAQNRVTNIYNVCSQAITEFTYGPLGEQCAATQNGITAYHIYLGTNVIAEYAADGDCLREFLDGPAGKLAMVDYTSAGAAAAGSPEIFFYLVGHLGSIVALTDANGDVVERYAYEPYGQTITTDPSGAPRSASAYGNPYAWTGQRYDADNQLYHFYFRTYSPHLGRWLQRDPLGYYDGLNTYQYTRSDPIVARDILGLAGNLGATGEFDRPGTNRTGSATITIFDDGGYWHRAKDLVKLQFDTIEQAPGYGNEKYSWVTIGTSRFKVDNTDFRTWLTDELNADLQEVYAEDRELSNDLFVQLVIESFEDHVAVWGIDSATTGEVILDPDDPDTIRDARESLIRPGLEQAMAQIEAGLQDYVNFGKQTIVLSVAIGAYEIYKGLKYTSSTPSPALDESPYSPKNVSKRQSELRRRLGVDPPDPATPIPDQGPGKNIKGTHKAKVGTPHTTGERNVNPNEEHSRTAKGRGGCGQSPKH